jgi:pyruvate-formate lyase-activating enzyme
VSNFLELALVAHQNGDLIEASRLYKLHLEQFPGDIRATYGLGSILLLGGKLEGLDLIRQSLSMPPDPNFDKVLAADSAFSTLISHQYREHARAFIEECFGLGIQVPDHEAKVNFLKLPSYLMPTAYDQQLGKNLRRYSPIESNKYVYAIDVVGGCNLRCPTCPVANQSSMPKGLMRIELFRDILKKISEEQNGVPVDIWLFNWTEPLLHPEIDLFVKAIKEFNFTSFISSNLNTSERLEALMKAEPDRLKVSLSSLKQEIYGITHERGDIEKVKENLIQLARLRDLYKAQTQIWVGHHLYKNTLAEQQEVSEFVRSLGFGYAPSVATLTPIEEVMRLMDQSALGIKMISGAKYEAISESFLFNPVVVQKNNSALRSGNYDCELRFNMTAIQYDGNVNLCCATVQSLTVEPISFLDTPKNEIEALKYDNPFCKKCISRSLHLTISDQ